jgi:UDP-glucose:(heptosyl)LPS alpha-1,3-glucosyltransferase
MRIALLHPRAALLGGVERQIHDLGVRLADAGHEVHWVCATRAAGVDGRIRCHRVPEPPGWLRAARPFAFDRLARRALASLGPFDVVHGFGKTSRQDVYRDGSGCLADFQAAAFEGQAAGWRAALRRLGPQALAVARIERERYGRGGCRIVLPISALVREQILRRYPLAPERVRVLHPAVDTARFSPRLAPAARAALRTELALPAAAPLLVFVGSDFRRKGLPALLAALRLLPGAHALVLGRDRPVRLRRARELAGELGVADRVHFAGLRPDPERLLAAADCLVFPSRYDAFGNAVLEAMASGLPVVVSRRAGGAEVVTPGRTGAVVDAPEDAAALAAAIRPFLAPALRAEAGRLARCEAERHGWDAQLACVLATYREVIEEKRREAALTRSGSGGAP